MGYVGTILFQHCDKLRKSFEISAKKRFAKRLQTALRAMPYVVPERKHIKFID